ncbi:tetratricopeptide repeat protein [Cystobacter ferrugineus]|uniref:Tetratricopeptide repeat protein n=1 Tax=Cystobacter ferrugineus TaxID=83449 RepID=A0A1L9BBB9_9BACT|nr:tetratricopeptide repeat protein [Cystobacter ferrugineus]OJH39562.1 hypothetical protein BON30_18890 [Cystobacter ferrugineus]
MTSSLGELLAAGQVKQAEDLAKQRLGKNINDAEALLTLAKVALLADDQVRAESMLQLASAQGAREEVALVRAALALQRQQWEQARIIYQFLASQSPTRTEALYGLGCALNRSNKSEAAREPLERAVALDPLAHAYHFELGRTWMALGRARPAARQFVSCLRLDKRDARAWRFLVELLLQRGKHRSADRLLKLGLEQVPDAEVLLELMNPPTDVEPNAALVGHLLELLERGRPREALKLVREAQDNGARSLALKLLEARACEGLRLVDEAIRAYEEASAKYPTDWEPCNDLSLFLLRQGPRYAERAITTLEEARRRAPDRPEPIFNLALAFSRNKRTAEGNALARQLVDDLPPEHPFHGHARQLLESVDTPPKR